MKVKTVAEFLEKVKAINEEDWKRVRMLIVLQISRGAAGNFLDSGRLIPNERLQLSLGREHALTHAERIDLLRKGITRFQGAEGTPAAQSAKLR